ncbi:MAG: spermidine/putrescine ABC transporter substrate-binding protein [Solirubrobacteraceae bacterium]
MRRAGSAGLVLATPGLLAACGGIEGSANENTKAPASVSHPKGPIDELSISNWPLYIDKQTNKDFIAQFDVGDLTYTEDVNDNEEFFGKIRQPLAQDKPTGRDLIVVTDWMAARMLSLGYLEPIDKANLPNAKNLQPGLASPVWDKDRSYSLPWQSGMTAIGVNTKETGGPISSFTDFFDPKFKGRISMLVDPRDAVNFILLRDAKDPATATIDVLAAVEEIDKLNRDGQIRRFTGNDYTQDLTRGNLAMAQAYSGDVIQLKAANPDLEFVIPQEGATLWSDNMLIPVNAAEPYGAEAYMNYVYDPKVAAQIAAYVNYVTPVVGAKEELAKIDPELAEDELIFPSDETLANLHPFVTLTEDEERQMNEAYQAVIGA